MTQATPPVAFEPGSAVKLKGGGINLSGAQFVRLDKKVRAMLESADTDNDGNMSLDELSKVMEITLQTEMRARNLKLLLKIGAVVCFVLILCIVGLSTATTFALKDAFTRNSMLADGHDNVLQTADARYPVALLAAPVLGMDILQTIDTITMTIPSLANAETGTMVRAEKVNSVDLISNTRVRFNLANGGKLEVWDGNTRVTINNEPPYDLCETNITCSALTVSAPLEAAAYLSEAQAILVAKGFGSTLRRRLQTADEYGCLPISTHTDASADGPAFISSDIVCTQTSCTAGWPEEITWDLQCSHGGEIVFEISDGKCGCEDTATPTTYAINIPEMSVCSLNMEDTYGDGWNGHTLHFSGLELPNIDEYTASDGGYTLQSGHSGEIQSFGFGPPPPPPPAIVGYLLDSMAGCYYAAQNVFENGFLASAQGVPESGLILFTEGGDTTSRAFSVCGEGSPQTPPTPPPPLPPGATVQAKVVYSITVSGSVDDFDQTDYKNKLAEKLTTSTMQVSPSDIELQVEAGSTVVTAIISTSSPDDATTASSELSALTPAEATEAFNVEVEAVSPAETTTDILYASPSPPPPEMPSPSSPPEMPPPPSAPCVNANIPGCKTFSELDCSCRECNYANFVMEPSADGSCTPCGAVADCNAGHRICHIDKQTGAQIDQCADVLVTFQFDEWYPSNGPVEWGVCGDFNQWCNGFTSYGANLSTQFRFARQGTVHTAQVFVPEGYHEYKYAKHDPQLSEPLYHQDQFDHPDVECSAPPFQIRGRGFENTPVLFWGLNMTDDYQTPERSLYNTKVRAFNYSSYGAGAGLNYDGFAQLQLPIHTLGGCPVNYPSGTGLVYKEIPVFIDFANAPLGLFLPRVITGQTGHSYSATQATADDQAERVGFAVELFNCSEYHSADPSLCDGVNATARVGTATIRVLANDERPVPILVESMFDYLVNPTDPNTYIWDEFHHDGGLLFGGQICTGTWGSSEHREPIRAATFPIDYSPTSMNMCWGDCRGFTLCECPLGQYRPAGSVFCRSCHEPTGGCPIDQLNSYAPFYECSTEADSVCGLKQNDQCGNRARTIQVNFAVFAQGAGTDTLPMAAASSELQAQCPECYTQGSARNGRFCRCIAEKELERTTRTFQELNPDVEFVLANYQEWFDKPELFQMKQFQHAELVKLERDRNVMIRPGMINIAVGQDIAGTVASSDPEEWNTGTLGTTWMGTPVTPTKRPVIVIRADAMTLASVVLSHEIGHVVGYPHILGPSVINGPAPIYTYGDDNCGAGSGCGFEIEYAGYSEPSCDINIMGYWPKDDCETTYTGLNTTLHGEVFKQMLECWLYDGAYQRDADCMGGQLDADGCQRGVCTGDNICECDVGWRAVKVTSSCNVCDWDYEWSNAAWDCVEAGSSCQTRSCVENHCALGCGPSIRGDGICQSRCNTAACDFDDGDCDGAEAIGWMSDHCHGSWIDDGVCDRACYQEGFDVTDCVNDIVELCPGDGLPDSYGSGSGSGSGSVIIEGSSRRLLDEQSRQLSPVQWNPSSTRPIVDKKTRRLSSKDAAIPGLVSLMSDGSSVDHFVDPNST